MPRRNRKRGSQRSNTDSTSSSVQSMDNNDSSNNNEKNSSSSASAVADTYDGSGADESKEERIELKCDAVDERWAGEEVTVSVPKALHEQYHFKPQHCGKNVILRNAQNTDFYRQDVTDARITLWVLTRKKADPKGQNHDEAWGYVKKRLYEVGRRKRIHVIFMSTNNFELVASKDGLENITYNGKPVEMPDIVIPRVGAGVDYFGLAVIRQIEKMGVLILNPIESINISRDKLHTLQHVSAHGMPIPKTLVAKFPLDLDVIQREFQYPIILKKASGSQGKGIIKLDNHGQLEDLVDMLDTTHPLIFQEFLSASSGRDLRVFVVGGKVVGAMMRIASKGFKANVHQGGSVKAVTIAPQVEWLVLETVKLIGLDIAGVDLLIDKNSYKICEVNSSPGFEGLEKAIGVDIAGKIMEYIEVRLGVWKIGAKKKMALSSTIPVQPDHMS